MKIKLLRTFAARRQIHKDLKAFRQYRAEFYEDLAQSQDDRIAVAEFLNSTARRMKDSQPAVSRVINRISNNLVGETLGSALKGIVPDSERIIIAAAEQSASLRTELRFLAENSAQLAEMLSNAKSAMFMPIITLAISWINVWLVCDGMLPLVQDLVPPDKIQGSTAAFLYGAYFVTYGTIPLMLLSVVLIVMVIRKLGSWSSARRRKVDNYYPMSAYRDIQGAMFMLALGSMIRAGKGIKESIQEIADKSGPWLRWHCNSMLNKLLSNPDKPGLAFNTGLLPAKVANRLIDLADRSDFPERLGDIGLTVVRQTNKSISNAAVRAELLVGVISSVILIGVSVGVPAIAESVMRSLK